MDKEILQVLKEERKILKINRILKSLSAHYDFIESEIGVEECRSSK